ncbi:hypothetical protein [Polaromonas sp. CG9_12]|nr:hypothetical protein [Polaromonas sp. CG9_12]
MFTRSPSRSLQRPREEIMNTIIYIVGLVVIIGVVLSYFGLR